MIASRLIAGLLFCNFLITSSPNINASINAVNVSVFYYLFIHFNIFGKTFLVPMIGMKKRNQRRDEYRPATNIVNFFIISPLF